MKKKRITIMLDETLAYLHERSLRDSSFTWELIVVNDGSKDHTPDIIMEYVQRESSEKVRLLNLEHNRGKGGAVKRVINFF